MCLFSCILATGNNEAIAFESIGEDADRFEIGMMGGTGTGPHYISVESEDQDDGFVFSNHAGVGLYYFFTKSAAVNISYRYRHVSNGGTRRPNLGIDSHLGLIGVSVFFDGN